MADVADAVPTRRVRNAVLARTRHSMCGWVREGSQTDSGFLLGQYRGTCPLTRLCLPFLWKPTIVEGRLFEQKGVGSAGTFFYHGPASAFPLPTNEVCPRVRKDCSLSKHLWGPECV